MVSYPDNAQDARSSLSRRAPSVASSRASTVRQHRSSHAHSHSGHSHSHSGHGHGYSQSNSNSQSNSQSQSHTRSHSRSHTGTSSTSSRAFHHQPHAQNEFPWFTHTGDVEILIATPKGEERFLLHKLILSQCSSWFDEQLGRGDWGREEGSREHGVGSRPGSRRGSVGQQSAGEGALVVRKRWMFELGEEVGGDEPPMLVQRVSCALLALRYAIDTDTSRTRTPPSRADRLAAHPPFPRDPPILPFPATTATPTRASSAPWRTSRCTPQPTIAQPPTTPHQHTTTRPKSPRPRPQPPPHQPTTHSAPTQTSSASSTITPPLLDPTNIANAYVDCKILLQLAASHGAADVIGPRVDHHLLRFHSRLWKQIAKYPPSYLKLGYLARSKPIFAEALTHVVGQWPAGQSQLRGKVPARVWELIEDKVDELDELKMRAEQRLMRISLTTSRGERVGPHNAFLDWLALSLFRGWVAERLTPAPPGILKDSSAAVPSTHSTDRSRRTSEHSRSGSRSGIGSLHLLTGHHRRSSRSSRARSPNPSTQPPPLPSIGTTFRLLGAGGAAYLDHDECKRFLKGSEGLYTRENLRLFERRLDEVKNLARDVVTPLLRWRLELSIDGSGTGGAELGYLTCMRVGEGEWPWDE